MGITFAPRFTTFCLISLAIFLSYSTANAQTAVPISCGQAVRGTINVGSQKDSYSFTGSSGDVINVRFTGTSGDLFPKLELLDAQINVIQSSSQGVLEQRLPAAGSYQLRIGDSAGSATGSYEFTFQRVNNPCGSTSISCGQTIKGSVAARTAFRPYTFIAVAGDKVSISFTKTSNSSGTFNPFIRLYDQGGNFLQQSTSGRLDVSLGSNGTYNLFVLSDFRKGTGDFEITFQRFNDPCGAVEIEQCRTLNATIIAQSGIGAFAFNGTTGQTAMLRITGTTTNFEPEMELYDPDGVFLDSSSFEIFRTLSKTGVYDILVRPAPAGMTGRYTLSLGNIQVNLSTPNGGQVILAGATVKIAWESDADDPSLQSHDILLSTDGGATYSTAIASGLSGSANTFNWIVPANLSASKARIRIIARDTEGNFCGDDSDGDFVVVGLPQTSTTVYKYDELNRLIQAIYEDGTAITYTYDASGNRLSEVVAPIPLFRVAASATTVSAEPGGTGSGTATVTSLNGFTSPVRLSCSGAPSGVSCAFSPSSVSPAPNGTVNSPFVVFASSSVAPGVYSFQVKGTSGDITRTFNMILKVSDFSVSCTPSSLSAVAGGSASSTCTVQSLNGFNSPVSLSCLSTPPGVSCSFNPATLVPPANSTGSTTVTVSAASSTPLGTHAFQVRATNGPVGRTSAMSLAVSPSPFEHSLLAEDFSGGIPSTWSVIDGGSGGGAAATWTTGNPRQRTIGAPFVSPFAIIDSDAAGSSASQDEQLVTPTLNTGGCSQTVLQFSNQFRRLSSEVADVDVSTNGGSTWTNVLRMPNTNDGFPTPNTKSIDLTSTTAANPSNVKVRFHYFSGNFEWWWAIDDVRVRCFTATACAFSISPTSQSFNATGGSGSVVVATQIGCGWTATTNASFITITSGGSGSGNGTVNYSVAANTGSARSGTISIAGQTFTVTQDSGCTFTIAPTGKNFTSSGGTGSVSVTTAAGCAWTATSNSSFITVTSGGSGSGDGTVNYSVAANTGPARTGTISIAGQTFTVTQDSGCTFTIVPTSKNFTASGGTGSVSVTTAAGCAWTATSNASFITITSGGSGSGNGTVGYSVAANTGAARTGTLTIAGQTFTVTQDPALPTITGFEPASACPGQIVRINGSNFGGATAVMFNGTSAVFSVVSAGQISATVPANASTGPISVVTPAGSATSAGSFTVIPGPTITTFSPAAGKAGKKVTISGTNLGGAVSVTFGGVPASAITKNTATSLKATVPAGAVTGKIGVTVAGGCSAISASDFIAAPSITSFNPASGAVGATVTITGLNFTGATQVKFKNASAQFTVVDNQTIQATVPPGAKTGSISVVTPAGTAKSSATFTVTP